MARRATCPLGGMCLKGSLPPRAAHAGRRGRNWITSAAHQVVAMASGSGFGRTASAPRHARRCSSGGEHQAPDRRRCRLSRSGDRSPSEASGGDSLLCSRTRRAGLRSQWR